MFQKMALVLFLLVFGSGCASSETEKKEFRAIFFPESAVAKNLVFLGIKGGGVYQGAGIPHINSGGDAEKFLRNLWTSPLTDKALYVEQVGPLAIKGEDGKIKTIQVTTIFVFSANAKGELQGWHITGEQLRSGAVTAVSVRYVTLVNWFDIVFIPKPDIIVYAWIEKEVADSTITPKILVEKIGSYRDFTFSILRQVQKPSDEPKQSTKNSINTAASLMRRISCIHL